MWGKHWPTLKKICDEGTFSSKNWVLPMILHQLVSRILIEFHNWDLGVHHILGVTMNSKRKIQQPRVYCNKKWVYQLTFPLEIIFHLNKKKVHHGGSQTDWHWTFRHKYRFSVFMGGLRPQKKIGWTHVYAWLSQIT